MLYITPILSTVIIARASIIDLRRLAVLCGSECGKGAELPRHGLHSLCVNHLRRVISDLQFIL